MTDTTQDRNLTMLSDCCVRTIQIHSRHNHMMVCSECKQVLKTFRDEQPMKNYLRFCASRARKVITSRIDGLAVVAYSSYEQFSGR